MAYDLSVAPAGHFGVVHLHGPTTGADILEAAEALASHSDWSGDFTAVWDATDMTDLDFGLQDLDRIIKQERRLRQSGEAGDIVVVVQDSVWVSLLTLFVRMMRDDRRAVRIVPDRAATCAHLGIAALYPE